MIARWVAAVILSVMAGAGVAWLGGPGWAIYGIGILGYFVLTNGSPYWRRP